MGDYLGMISSRPLASISTVAAVTILPLVIIAYKDYRDYISFGPHGLPDNVYGWYRQLRMMPMARNDTLVPAPYGSEVTQESGPNSMKTFFSKPLPARSGHQPEVCAFVAPQRQYDQRASSERTQQMHAYLAALAEANPTVLQMQNSRLEGPIPSIFMKDEIARPETLKRMRGETIHIHPLDGSTHMLLSLADQKDVIEKGWGQRHRLSGTAVLSWNYTFIYAPRDDEEFEVWKDFVCSAAKFCSSLHVGTKVKSPAM